MPCHDPNLFSRWTGGVWEGEPPDRVFGFSIDTREIREGEMFVAISTARRDGHRFLRDARTKGAAAALVREPDPRVDIPQLVVTDPVAALQAMAARHRTHFHGPIVAVTGSCGKTSTKELLALVLGEEGIHRNEGNLNNHLGVPLSLLGLDPERHRCGIVEIGINRPGEMSRLAALVQPDVVVVTTVGAAHLEGLESLDGVAAEKAALLDALRSGGTAVFTADCLRFKPFREWRGDARIMVSPSAGDETVPAPGGDNTFSLEPTGIPAGRDVGVEQVAWAFGSSDRSDLTIPRVSRGMRNNIALACAVAARLGVDSGAYQERLLRWRAAPFRGERLRIGASDYYIDCYNANPQSMIDSIEAFESMFPECSRMYVLGCMEELGPSASEWHEWIGERLLLREGDAVILIGPYAESYRDGIVRSGRSVRSVRVVEDLAEARTELDGFRGAILLKGSRVYGLEALLPENWRASAYGGRKVC